MTPRAVLLTLGLAAAVGLAGCTVTGLKDDSDRAAARVRDKELALQQAQQRQAELQAERQRLMDELRTRELTLAELELRMQAIARMNAATTAATAVQQRQKIQRENELAQAGAQVRALKETPNLTAQDKARRLEEVRQRLRATLELLAAS